MSEEQSEESTLRPLSDSVTITPTESNDVSQETAGEDLAGSNDSTITYPPRPLWGSSEKSVTITSTESNQDVSQETAGEDLAGSNDSTITYPPRPLRGSSESPGASLYTVPSANDPSSEESDATSSFSKDDDTTSLPAPREHALSSSGHRRLSWGSSGSPGASLYTVPPAHDPSAEESDAASPLSKDDDTTSLPAPLPREQVLGPSHPEKNASTENEEAIMDSLLDGTERAILRRMRKSGVANVVIKHYYYKQADEKGWSKSWKDLFDGVIFALFFVSIGILVALRFHYDISCRVQALM